ncbi:dynein beta chain, ciliary-like isoform X2 [Cimex lectularius]|uniref:Dynein heavy chain n=1 Tax=Cimex lectularius TaxID=79782 RepID=A0A8I6RRZ2_CIMLE|nr:dynein beta chain, ciliary-like isoform X2 [Cimex lectularius]
MEEAIGKSASIAQSIDSSVDSSKEDDKKDLGGEEEEIGETDPRLIFLFMYLKRVMKFRLEKWTKMMGTEDTRAIILKFFNIAEKMTLFITILPSGLMWPTFEYPANTKAKTCFLMKKVSSMITPSNLRELIIFGDLSPKPIEEIVTLVDDILVPMITSPSNEKWPKTLIDDVTRRVQDMKDVVSKFKGDLQGAILLPLPDGIDRVYEEERNIKESKGKMIDVQLRMNYESAVLNWSIQLNEGILKRVSTEIFQEQKHPLPSAEFKWWGSRVKNLEEIYEQLTEPKVKRMARILEMTESVFLPCFNELVDSVMAALKEAREMDKYFYALKKPIDKVQAIDFEIGENTFIPLIHSIALMWVHCPYFCNNTKLNHFMSLVLNMIIDVSYKAVDPPSLFQGEFDENFAKLKKVVENLKLFKKLFESYDMEIGKVFPPLSEPVYWIYETEELFNRYNDQIKRLTQLEEVFAQCIEYQKLEKVEIGGYYSYNLSRRLGTLYEEFNAAVEVLRNIQYDPGDLDDNSWERDFQVFKEKIKDFDNRMAAICALGFDNCTNFRDIFSMVYLFRPFLDRPIVDSAMAMKYSKISQLYKEEVAVEHKIYLDQLDKYKQTGGLDVANNWPPVAGAINWMRGLKCRISYPLEELEQFEHESCHNDDMELLMKRAKELIGNLGILEEEVLQKWFIKVPDEIRSNLKKTIITISNAKLLNLNFDKKLIAALREVRFMNMMGGVEGIPEDALELFARSDELHLWNTTLTKTVGWYNMIRQKTKPQEFDIVQDEIAVIDVLIQQILDWNNWKSPNNWECIEKLRDSVWVVADRVMKAQENLKRVIELINQWNFKPLYSRIPNKKESLLQHNDLVSVNRRYDQIIAAGEEIYRLIDINFRLLHDLPVIESASSLDESKKDDTDISQQLSQGMLEEKVEEEEAPIPVPPKITDIHSLSRGSILKKKKAKDEDPESSATLLDMTLIDVEGFEELEEEAEEEEEEIDEEEEEDVQMLLFERPYMRAMYMSDLWKSARGYPRPKPEDYAIVQPRPEEVKKKKKEKKEGKKGKAKKAGGGGGKKGGKKKKGTVPEEDEKKANEKKGGKGKKVKIKVEEERKEDDKSKDKKSIDTIRDTRGVSKLDLPMLDDGFIWGDKREDMDEEKKDVVLTNEEEKPSTPKPTPSQLYNQLMEQFALNPSKINRWDRYLDMVDDFVEEGLLHAVGVAIGYFIEEMAAGNEPLFEVKMKLQEPDIIFEPSLNDDAEDPKSLIGLMNLITKDLNAMALLVPRISYRKRAVTYMDDVTKNPDIINMEAETMKKFVIAMAKLNSYMQDFYDYSYLWTTDRTENLRQFLKYNKLLTPDELQMEKRMLEDPNAPKLPQEAPRLVDFKNMIEHYEKLYAEIYEMDTTDVLDGWLRIDLSLFKHALLDHCHQWGMLYKNHLKNDIIFKLTDLNKFIDDSSAALAKPLVKGDYDGLVAVIGVLLKINERSNEADTMFEPMRETVDLLKAHGVDLPEDIINLLAIMPERWINLKKVALSVKANAAPLLQEESNTIRRRLQFFDVRQHLYYAGFKKKPFFSWGCWDPYIEIDKCDVEVKHFEEICERLTEQAGLFEVPVPEFKMLKTFRKELKLAKILWDYILVIKSTTEDWESTSWKKIDSEVMDMEMKKYSKELRLLDKTLREWDLYFNLESIIKNLLTALRAITELQNPSMRERHWKQLMQATNVKFTVTDTTTLRELLDLNLHKFEEEVKTIVDKSVKEQQFEKTLTDLRHTWANMEFAYEPHARSGCKVLKISEEIVETLEENQTALQNMLSSKFVSYFIEEVTDWQKKLSTSDQVIHTWSEVQRTWMHLESIFIGSDDIRKQLPEDSKRFDKIDKEFKAMLHDIAAIPNVVKATNRPHLQERLENMQEDLAKCEKALSQYLETKRLAFPRFYFLSSVDLLDILSNSNNPEAVCKHLTKLYDSVSKLKFKSDGQKTTKSAIGMWAKDGEFVTIIGNCECSGQVEKWLNNVTSAMRRTLRNCFNFALHTYDDKPREKWVFDYPAQVSLVGTQIMWSMEVEIAFGKLEEGYENALKEYNKKQIMQLNNLINLMLGDLSDGERQKITTICTIDVHSRDVIAKLIAMKVESNSAFQWQAQLRHRWDYKISDCYVNICDAQFKYDYEYLGNIPRLVITPLTDRCYITLSQSLHLVMGGAPAGPAGTGKTETTKDLGKGLGMMVYVFNCSEQMDYRSCGNIYKGLAQTGAWGCFDEFNRISVEVLSVIATQVKTVLDAIKSKKRTFNFQGEMITLIPTVGIFITMNPGYAGRAELPENLKALFRPCAMVVPDFDLICEIMLIGEAFQEARVLGKKFLTLYSLCKELLSKQDHYDWGLRAIKSVLVIAGKLRRADPDMPEEQVLMRALRDFNIPKIVTDDVNIFMGLIGDLFPALDVPRKRDLNFEAQVRQAALDMSLQPEDGFILKICQLQELFSVRHSVFIIGFAGTGKSCVWKTLYKTYANMKRKPHYNDLEPKAVTNDELFGIINPQTREWKDGLFSVLIREQAQMSGDGPKWMVMDGDIDPMWIESLNTVMDDNKVLTLASNERIALTPSMRLLFEISNLRSATPATVSRAGILYINPTDLGWNPYVASWLDTRSNESEKMTLQVLFEKYIPPVLDANKAGKWKKITPIPDIAHIQMLCVLLECLIIPVNCPSECPKEWYEIYFVFACVWAFGSSTFKDQIVDWRMEFTRWWINEFKSVKFPVAVQSGNAPVFDYYIDQESKRFLPWTDKIVDFELDYDIPLQAALVNTSETARVRYFLDLLMEQHRNTMLIGNAGCGKSVVILDKMSSLSDKFAVTNIAFNFYTTSELLQKVLEKPLEKKAGRNYAPQGNKHMIYFIDDMNMPEVDKYGTVQPHTLIRQHMDYQHWYDRQKLTLKDIHNIMFVACMNPTAGSFSIDGRLQRHFAVFALSFPSNEALNHIYTTLLSQHLHNPTNKFQQTVMKTCDSVVNCAIQLHFKMQQTFLPTAIKFHYIFNLRDLSSIFQIMIQTSADCIVAPVVLLKLWMHEATRVYCDRLVEHKDQDLFHKVLIETIKRVAPEFVEEEYSVKPLLFCHFSEGLGDPKYMPCDSWQHLNKLLNEAMSQYNDIISTMNLVLFEDAMAHICRINRVMEMPRGNALLVGVGGSGKQSLSRLSAFISSLDAFQIQLRKGYGIPDLKADIAQLYIKAGLKNVAMMFLMTDSQIPEEKFLVSINDMLASGEIPDLFADDEIDNICKIVAPEAKSAGMKQTKDGSWSFYIDRVRRNIKTILCFSPVGSTLRVRARKFPALVNCTTIDWFMEWPKKALENVSFRFLFDNENLPDRLKSPMSLCMAAIHTSVNNMSNAYLLNERRYNYTTPKSFLELISLYTKLLKAKFKENRDKIKRLQSGLQKLITCSEEAALLKSKLNDQKKIVAQKNQAASELVRIVGREAEKVAKEKVFAQEEERKCQIIEIDVSIKQKMCEEDLEKAMPALEGAAAALDTLDKKNLIELKSFGTPHEAVAKVASAVLVLMSKGGKVPRDRSWKACKVMMGTVDQFLYNLQNFNKENIHPEVVKAIQPYLADPDFDPKRVVTKSSAAGGLCEWVINIMKFHEVWMVVLPKKNAEAAARNELNRARAKLEEINNKINKLEEELGALTRKFEQAVAEKMACQAEEEKMLNSIDLANRLINGLSSENSRWKETVVTLSSQLITFPGDILIIASFISYLGCFTRKYREDLMTKQWLHIFDSFNPKIPSTPQLDAMAMLSDDAQVAQWQNEGLPNDRMSAENATILTHCARWPLMIDPQLQGLKWIKQRIGKDLRVLRLGTKNYLDRIENAITEGATMLIENLGETIEPVLDNLLGRNFIRKGKVVKIGDREIDYHKKFRLILQTKLANPHYQPEIQAQTTLINFTVTKDGLEEQLLAEVVKAERPDLEILKSTLTKQMNNFKILIKSLEDELLQRLTNAGPDILNDRTLVERLETTKKTSEDIAIKVTEAKQTSSKIDIAREIYRPVALRSSIMYFIMNELHKINPLYQFSLKAFSIVFHDAIEKCEPSDDIHLKVNLLTDTITFNVFMYTVRALFECDKLTFMSLMGIQILSKKGEIQQDELDFLLRSPYIPNLSSPCDFLSNVQWGGVRALSLMDEFKNLDKDIEGSMKRWKKFVEGECPERDKFPQDWKNKSAFQKLCMMRALRPDRMSYAMRFFIEEKLGSNFVTARTVSFEKSYLETSATTPVFFILSPGVDPTRDVERIGKRLGFTADKKNFHNISLGQGQEPIAEKAIENGAKLGHWVILQNVHLVARWLPTLDKKMEASQENPHPDFRLYISSEPAPVPSMHAIPQGVLESSIKITNEPPTGMFNNLHKALDNFSQDTLEMCSKEAEFKAILFSLCYFHAVVAERRKFGPAGWNRKYPFNVGDLIISVQILYNYLENNSKVPWEDLRYLFGEIMYGGHITDDWDRRLCRSFLKEYMNPDLMEGDLYYAPGFQAPPNSDYIGYHRFIDAMLPSESPILYGLHPNAEIGVLTTQADSLFRTIFELQPRDAGAESSGGITKEEKVKGIIDDILDKLPQPFSIADMMARTEDRSPFTIVAFQECERMNILMNEMSRTLKELALGLKGELTISRDMEVLQESLFLDEVPENWSKRAYPSNLPLSAWYADLQQRLKELEGWVGDFLLPSSVWLGGLFNPQSFLTAIMQNTARKNEWPLDKMCLQCDVTKKIKEEISSSPRDGAYINGLYMEGARWDSAMGTIVDSKLKELYPLMPVIQMKAITIDKQDLRSVYECPVYKTKLRGPTYVWTFNLKTKQKASKWILAGVCLLLSI